MENRASRRIELKAAISLHAEGIKRVHGWIKDVSITGAHIKTDEYLPIGTLCEATLVVRDGEERRRLMIPSKIMRHDAEGLGIQFTEMSDDIRAELSRVLLQNLSLHN